MQVSYNAQLDKQVALVQQIDALTDGWTKSASKGNSTLFTRKWESYSLNLAKIESVIPCNIEACKKYFNEDFEAQHKSKDNSDFIQQIEKLDDTTKIVQFKLKGKIMVSSRDFLCVQQIRQTANGGYIIVKVNLSEHEKQVKSKDTVRGEVVINGNVFTPLSATSTKVVSYYLMDPKGSIPSSLVNSQMEKQLESQEKAIPFMQAYKL